MIRPTYTVGECHGTFSENLCSNVRKRVKQDRQFANKQNNCNTDCHKGERPVQVVPQQAAMVCTVASQRLRQVWMQAKSMMEQNTTTNKPHYRFYTRHAQHMTGYLCTLGCQAIGMPQVCLCSSCGRTGGRPSLVTVLTACCSCP